MSLPQLREARLSPGGCVLNSKRLFIFGGRSKSGSVDSIECLQLDLEINWKIITQKNRSFSHACSVVGVSIRGEILVFGGKPNSNYCMYRCTEEEDLIEDLTSASQHIPGLMGMGVV